VQPCGGGGGDAMIRHMHSIKVSWNELGVHTCAHSCSATFIPLLRRMQVSVPLQRAERFQNLLGRLHTVIRARDGGWHRQGVRGVVRQLSTFLAAGEPLGAACHPEIGPVSKGVQLEGRPSAEAQNRLARRAKHPASRHPAAPNNCSRDALAPACAPRAANWATASSLHADLAVVTLPSQRQYPETWGMISSSQPLSPGPYRSLNGNGVWRTQRAELVATPA
jgi:hypothetical protein